MMLLDYWSNVAQCSYPDGDVAVESELPTTAEGVFLAYAPRVYSVARRMLSNDTDAEDVTQEVLLQVVRKLDTFRGESGLTTWLHRVTVNAALTHRRKQKRRHEHQVDAPLDFLSDQGNPTSTASLPAAPDQKLLEHEMREVIENAIAQLPEIYRDVYVLADVEGLSNAEIGDMLGLSIPAIKSRLHRARLMMREILEPYF
ncbi:MAG TPA: sigma-70 family RNA polymerase sigma factor [Gemmataceae bacterium]|jgi:RNA polymerase sigma-70 factor (ECF subfamily)